MAFANDPTDPANMTPEERLTEIASLLAGGFLRLRRRTTVRDSDGLVIHRIESAESAGKDLEVPSETSLHGQRG